MKWIQLAKNTVKELGEDDCSTQAQAIAYSAFFSIFPLLLGAVGILGFFVTDPAVQQQVLNTAYANMPASGDFISKTLQGVIDGRESVTLVATLLLVASGRTVVLSIVHALNVAFDAPKELGFIQNVLLAFKLLFSVGLLFVLSLGITAVIQVLASVSILGFGPFKDTAILTFVQFTITTLVSFFMFLVLYRLAPNVPLTWRDVMPGAVLAAVLFEVAKLGFVIYVRQFLNTEVYGAIGGVIVLLTWCYFSSLILLLGAEFAAEFMHLREKDPVADRGKVKADANESIKRDVPAVHASSSTPNHRPERGKALAAVAITLVAAFITSKVRANPQPNAG